jgi:hypothetical protein
VTLGHRRARRVRDVPRQRAVEHLRVGRRGQRQKRDGEDEGPGQDVEQPGTIV